MAATAVLQVGPKLASSPSLATSLLALLESTAYAGGGEELVLNAVCALTNLSFYHTRDNKVRAQPGGAQGSRHAS